MLAAIAGAQGRSRAFIVAVPETESRDPGTLVPRRDRQPAVGLASEAGVLGRSVIDNPAQPDRFERTGTS